MDIGGDYRTARKSPAVQFSCLGACTSRDKLSRSTPGESVTAVFLEMLKGGHQGKASTEECALCHRVLAEEVTRLRELAQRFQSAMFVQWMTPCRLGHSSIAE